MTAMFTDKFLESFQESIMKPGGYFGAVSPSFDTAFQVNRNVSTHLLSLFRPLVGVLCGALAALFTASNLVTTKLRKVHIRWKQVQAGDGTGGGDGGVHPIAVIIPLMFPHVDGCILEETNAPSAGIGAGRTRTGGV